MTKMIPEIINSDMPLKYAQGCWSNKATIEFLMQTYGYSKQEAKNFLDENQNIKKASGPTQLAQELSKQISKGISILPFYNKFGGNVLGTLFFFMDYYEKNGVLPKLLGTIEIEIKHCLCGKPGQTREQIKNGTIYSHRQAIEQCKEKIKNAGINSVEDKATDTKLEKAKTQEGVLLLIDEDTAKENGLQIYDKQMGPKNNRTSFAVITSDPNLTLPNIKGNNDLNVGIIKADNSHGGLLLSLLPMILGNQKIDMKAITSSLNGDTPMIGIVGTGETFNDTKGAYEHMKIKNPDALKTLMRKLNFILKKNYSIKVTHNVGNIYTLSSKNKPGALVKMLILLEYNKINLNSIDSEINGNEVNIKVQTNDKIIGLSEANIPEGIKEHLENFIDKNINRIHEIITV